jgi:hypothetical protein
LTEIRAQQTVPFSSEQSAEVARKTQKPFLHTVLYAPPPVLLELVNSVADDVATFSLLGLLGKKLGDRAARFSDWCWLFSTLAGLVENGFERQLITSLTAEGTFHLCVRTFLINLLYNSGGSNVQGINGGSRLRQIKTQGIGIRREGIGEAAKARLLVTGFTRQTCNGFNFCL